MPTISPACCSRFAAPIAPSSIIIEPDDGKPGGWTHRQFARELGRGRWHESGDRFRAGPVPQACRPRRPALPRPQGQAHGRPRRLLLAPQLGRRSRSSARLPAYGSRKPRPSRASRKLRTGTAAKSGFNAPPKARRHRSCAPGSPPFSETILCAPSRSGRPAPCQLADTSPRSRLSAGPKMDLPWSGSPSTQRRHESSTVMPIITAEAARKIVAAEMIHGIMCIDPSNVPPRYRDRHQRDDRCLPPSEQDRADQDEGDRKVVNSAASSRPRSRRRGRQ